MTPTSFDDVASVLAAAAAAHRRVRVVGGGTKHGWGRSPQTPELLLRTTGLDRTLEHNAGDLTAIFEAGVPLARAQAELARAGQRIALDPPLHAGDRRGGGPQATPAQDATLGGVFATGDSGPLRHRYGLPRDLILGITVALSDGTIARAGGKVIKNVAGYDLAKLFTGAFGTLGVILSVSVRLHPIPETTATALGTSDDPEALTRASLVLARAPLELESLDVAWRNGRGGLLARLAGVEAERRARRVAGLMAETGLDGIDVVSSDDGLWARQQAGQRSAERALIRVHARPSGLSRVLRAADATGATLVGRVAFGTSYLELDPPDLPALRSALPEGVAIIVLDLPPEMRDRNRAWPEATGPRLALMRAVKERFDPAGICNPGVFVGDI